MPSVSHKQPDTNAYLEWKLYCQVHTFRFRSKQGDRHILTTIQREIPPEATVKSTSLRFDSTGLSPRELSKRANWVSFPHKCQTKQLAKEPLPQHMSRDQTKSYRSPDVQIHVFFSSCFFPFYLLFCRPLTEFKKTGQELRLK